MATDAKTSAETFPTDDLTVGEVASRLRSLQLGDGERRGGGGTRGRRLFWAVLLLTLIGGGAYLGFTEMQKQAAAAVLEVDAIRLPVDPGQETLLDLVGYIVPKSKISISPQIGGKLVELPVLEGMRVKKGDLIARVEDDSFKADLAQARASHISAKSKLQELRNGALPAEIEQAKALLEQAAARQELMKRNLERIARLKEKNPDNVSQLEFDRATAELADVAAMARSREESLKLLELGPRDELIAAATAEVERAAALVEKAEFWVANASIYSPIDGTILERKADQGESVHPELIMTSLCEIADLTQLEAEVDVQEQDLKKVQVGNPCKIIPDAYPERTYPGRVDRLQPVVSRQRGVVQTRVTVLDPDEYLLVEMNCRVIFMPTATADENKPKPRIPKQAVVNDQGETAVFVADAEIARRRVIQLGADGGDSVEVTAGLVGGELVLLANGRALVDGQAVRPKLAGKPAAAPAGQGGQ